MFEPFLFGLICVVVLALVAEATRRFWGDPGKDRKRELAKIAVTPIAEAKEGELVRIRGRVKLAHARKPSSIRTKRSRSTASPVGRSTPAPRAATETERRVWSSSGAPMACSE